MSSARCGSEEGPVGVIRLVYSHNHNQTDWSPKNMADISLSKFHPFDNHHSFIPVSDSLDKPPRICVICMASYNQDILHGVWINMAQDLEVIYGSINDMLSKSPASNSSDWSIFAYEGFESIPLNKHEDIERIHEKAIFLATYGKWGIKVLEHFDNDIYLAEEAIVNHYQGQYSSELDFAINLFDKECGLTLPEHAKIYVDYEAFQKGIFGNDYFSIEGDGEAHVFSVMKGWCA